MPWGAQWSTGDLEEMGTVDLHEDLRQGLIVQRASIEPPSFSLTTTSPVLLTDVVSAGDLFTNGWYAGYHKAMTDLLVWYTNHTDNSGIWDGVNYVDFSSIPTWTEATLIAAIGDSVRLPAPVSEDLVNDWAIQQYKMINMLRWANVGFFDASTTITPTREDSTKGITNPIGSGWAAAQALFISSASWGGWSTGRTLNVRGGLATGFRYTISASRIRFTLNWSLAYQHSLDFYVPSSTNTTNWITLGAMDQEDKINIIQSLGESTGTSRQIQHFIDSDYNTAVNAMLDPNASGGTLNTNTGDVIYLIAKFDGANGFTYKDW